ncbi:MAG: RagB/SusD family nutrient uptake outer membrane protein [Dysgonamonadaceae bacterium]|jgi:hypothetical protein|nr:RagB/SusD family nutrient uptake outer membrane protein [Dysgonamonadaceae bacterium]
MKAKLCIVALMSIALFGSCDDFLDVVPDNRTVLDSPDAVQQLLVDAYPSAHYFHICEIMSDNAGERNTTTTHSREVLNEEMYFWKEGFLSGTNQDTPSYLWNGYYNAIASANQALQSISEAPDQSKYSAQKGEALLCRAFAHFILANIFAEHYDPATADEKLGIPYNTEPENIAIKRYKRNSIAEVYALIEKDLTEGLPLIDDNVYEVPKYHFTKAAANAFASRFYLYKGDWDKTIQHATIALGDNIEGKILPLNTTAFTGAAAETYRTQYRRIDQPDVLLLIGAASWWARDHYSSSLRYGMIGRQRETIFTTVNIEGTAATYYRAWYTAAANAYYLYKYPEYFKYTYQGASTGVGYVMGALLTIEEVLMNRAEAYIMKDGADNFGKAIDDMSVLLKKRINLTAVGGIFSPITLAKVKSQYDNKQDLYPDLSPFYKSSVSADQMSLLKFVTDWRRKEFFLEGMRWFDIKRFHLEVTHYFDVASATNSNIKPIVLSANDLRRALQIPSSAQAFGVEANPR